MVTFPVNAGTVDGARIPVNKGTYSRLGVKVVCMKLSTQASEFPECGRGPLYNSLKVSLDEALLYALYLNCHSLGFSGKMKLQEYPHP